MMYIGTLSYFSELQCQGQIASVSSKEFFNLAAAEGTFGYEPNVTYLFGSPKNITNGGVQLDIPFMVVNASTNGNNQKRKDFAIRLGMLASTLEHEVPKELFINESNPVDGASTMKALEIASSIGQKIYTITKDNMDEILPNLNHTSTVINEITIALNQGKEVITHTESVNIVGWIGSGYIIIDQVTGDGAYKISGGANGGYYAGFAAGLMLSMFTIADVKGVPAISARLAILIALVLVFIVSYVGATIAMLNATGGKKAVEKYVKCFLTGLSVGLMYGAIFSNTMGDYLMRKIATALGYSVFVLNHESRQSCGI